MKPSSIYLEDPKPLRIKINANLLHSDALVSQSQVKNFNGSR
jgi:hypothetical protein